MSNTRYEEKLPDLYSLNRDQAQQHILKYLEQLLIEHTEYDAQLEIENVKIMEWVQDSLTAIKLKAHIEKDIGIEIDVSELFEEQSLLQLTAMMIDLVDELRHSSSSSIDSGEEKDFFTEELQKMSDEEINELYEQIQKSKS
ncbi:acyl carrier protein [Halalkalibacterium halodurans]|uniref:acyl carrier protein n=1 Tax=Halalkalibacterium halodurans TaxID=86665 RepID=UPI001067DD24|nr:acyl carrier protein [Halalkalibacterium halodurans]TES55751.1 acyl carrier protein [Halalkalibacterium halodurans]